MTQRLQQDVKIFIQSTTQLPANKQVQYFVKISVAVLALKCFTSDYKPLIMCGSLSLQKLTLEGHGVLKDALSLAFYNVSSGTEFLLQLKTRGGK